MSSVPTGPEPHRWLPWRSASLALVLVILAFETVGGAYLLFVEFLGKLPLLMLYLHVVLGVVVALPFCLFMRGHLHTVSVRRLLESRVDKVLRHGAWVTLLLSLVTGLFLFVVGVSGQDFAWWVHLVVSLVGVVLLLLHIAARFVVPGAGARRPRLLLQGPHVRWAVRSALLVGLVMLVSWGAAEAYRYAWTPLEKAEGYVRVRDSNPFEPGMVAVTYPGLARRSAYANSRTCGLSGCHEGLYKEWTETAHHWSANRVVLRVVQDLQTEAGGNEVSRHCGSCHFPVAVVAGETEALKPGASPADLQRDMTETYEGSSCVLCHLIEDVTQAGGGANVIAEPKEFVPTDGHDELRNYLYRQAVLMKPAAHGRSYTMPFYSSSRACAGCHERFQMDSWKQGPYYHADDPKKREHCQSCHMPAIPLADEVITRLKGKTKSHRFPAANVNLPTWLGYPDQVRVTREFIAKDRVKMAIAAPERVAPAARVPVTVTLYVDRVGHTYPAGPEQDLLEAWVQLKAFDARGREVFSSGVPDERHHLPRDSYVYAQFTFDSFYRSVTEVFGQRHSTWYWQYALVHVIPSGHADDVEYVLSLPPDLPAGPVRLEAALRQRKINQEFMDRMFPGETSPIMEVASCSATLEAAPEADAGPAPARGFPQAPRAAPYYLQRLVPRPAFLRDVSFQALVEFDRGRREEAVARLEAVRRDFGRDYYDVELALGKMLARLGRTDEAVEVLDGAVGLRVDDSESWRLLADLLEKKGNLEEARALRQEAEEVDALGPPRPTLDLESYRPTAMDPPSNDALHKAIMRGDYDRSFPYRILNRPRMEALRRQGLWPPSAREGTPWTAPEHAQQAPAAPAQPGGKPR